MGFFKSVSKAYKAGQKAQKQYQKTNPQAQRTAPPPKPHKQKVPQIDSALLVLPDLVPSDMNGVMATKVAVGNEKRIGIVGEQWKHGNIQGVMNAGGDQGFEIYLMNDHNNAHDKKAVGVYAAGVQIGFIPKPDNNVWNKLVKNASNRHEFLWGKATAYMGQEGYWQVKGFIYHDNLIAPSVESLESKRMTPAAMAKNVQVLKDAEDADRDMETVAQAKSWAKKASKAAAAFYSHSLWVLEQGESEEWQAVQDEALIILEDEAEEMAFIEEWDEYYSLLGSISDLLAVIPDQA